MSSRVHEKHLRGASQIESKSSRLCIDCEQARTAERVSIKATNFQRDEHDSGWSLVAFLELARFLRRRGRKGRNDRLSFLLRHAPVESREPARQQFTRFRRRGEILPARDDACFCQSRLNTIEMRCPL